MQQPEKAPIPIMDQIFGGKTPFLTVFTWTVNGQESEMLGDRGQETGDRRQESGDRRQKIQIKDKSGVRTWTVDAVCDSCLFAFHCLLPPISYPLSP
jgi:hypothetical protein